MDQKISLAKKLRDPKRRIGSCFVGFDGFTDELLTPVMLRDQDTFTPFPSIASFGERIVAAAGKSCNIELVPKTTKLGGNAAILAQALLEGGHALTFAGNIGSADAIEPLFQPMANRCEKVIPLGQSGHTDALEFCDGKVMLGKMRGVLDICWDTLIQAIPLDELILTLDKCHLWVLTNWTMTPKMDALWRHLIKDVIPKLPSKKGKAIFIDIADPAKRSDADLLKAIHTLADLNQQIPVTLGLNISEAARVAKLIGCDPHDLAHHAHLHQVIVHTSKFVYSSNLMLETEHVAHPKITTGAGDHFNSGICNGMLSQFSEVECLQLGITTAMLYIQNGKSPTMEEIADVLENKASMD